MEVCVITRSSHFVMVCSCILVMLDTLTPLVLSPVSLRSVAADIKPIAQSLQLQCPPCEKVHCSPRKGKRLRCKGGITRGVCNCCPVCAKLKGERCGGEYNYRGKCDRGLKCDPEVTNRKKLADLMTAEQRKTWTPDGICTEVLPHERGYGLNDQPFPSYCKPKCTPEYCTKSPRALCSAVDNAEKSHSCHGDCRHTSCRACRYVKDDVGCGKCAQDDYPCIKTFGRCIKDSVCTRKKHPCRPNILDPGAAKFQCLVPECVSP